MFDIAENGMSALGRPYQIVLNQGIRFGGSTGKGKG